MNVWLGITLEVRKGGLQIYIQMKGLRSSLFEYHTIF